MFWVVVPMALGAGVWMGGKGVNEASNGASKATIAVLAAGGGYLYLKKKGVL